MTMQVDLEALHEGDRLDDLELLYSYKTNQSNIISLYIYNYTDGTWFTVDNQSHLEFFNGTFSIEILISCSSIEFDIVEFPLDLIANITQKDPNQSSDDYPKTSDATVGLTDLLKLAIGAGQTMGIIGGLVSIFVAIKENSKNSSYERFVNIMAGIATIAAIIILIIRLTLIWEKVSIFELLGMTIGCIGAAIWLFRTADYIKNTDKYMHNEIKRVTDSFGVKNNRKGFYKGLILLSQTLDLAFAYYSLKLDYEELVEENDENEDNLKNIGMACFSLGTGLFSLWLARQSIIMMKGHRGKREYSYGTFKKVISRDDKAYYANIFGWLSIGASIVFYALTIKKLAELNEQ